MKRNATLLEKMARRAKAMEKQELFKAKRASDVDIDDHQVPPTPKINEQAGSNNQGSGDSTNEPLDGETSKPQACNGPVDTPMDGDQPACHETREPEG